MVDHCWPQLSFDFSGRRTRENVASIHDMLKLNKIMRSATSILCELKIPSIPRNHLRFMGVHDAAHANVEGGTSQQAHVILAVHKNVTEHKVPVFHSELEQQEDQESGAQECDC